MAFTEADRVQIRRFLCYPAGIYPQSFNELENKITRAQSIADGGLRPDNSTEAFIKGLLANLQQLETARLNLIIQMQVSAADETKIDAPRGLMGLAMLGRSYIGQLSGAVDTKPLWDFYSPRAPEPSGGEDLHGQPSGSWP